MLKVGFLNFIIVVKKNIVIFVQSKPSYNGITTNDLDFPF